MVRTICEVTRCYFSFGEAFSNCWEAEGRDGAGRCLLVTCDWLSCSHTVSLQDLGHGEM